MKPTGIQKKGDAEFKEGQSQVTTSIFRWSKDYSSGASHFQQALKCYKQANCFQKAIDTLKELIVCNQKLMDTWATARNYEALLQLYIAHQTPAHVLKQTAINAFVHFRMSDSFDKGLTIVGNVAKHFLTKGLTQQGLQLLNDAYKTGLQEKSFKKQDIFNQIITVYIQSNLFAEAERLYRQEIQSRKGGDCTQMGLIAILLVVMQHEVGRANSLMYDLGGEIPNFLESDEAEVADNLMKSYKKGDAEGFKKITTKAAITCIFPVCIIRKLREVKVPVAAAEGQVNNDQLKDLLY